MNIQAVAYWGAFAIPLVLLGFGILIRVTVAQGKFQLEQLYIGLDLTVYFLAVVMTNFLDLAKDDPVPKVAIIYSLALLVTAIFFLLTQIWMHQVWLPKERTGRTQFVILGLFSNFLGILLLYGFVQFKARGMV
jgi:hypothetical protein